MRLGRAFASVAARVLPSVVSLRIEAEAELPDGITPFLWPFPFGFPGEEPRRPPLVRAGGSGVIVREDGIILTNHHVVENARRIEVRLHDGRTFRARVLGTDPATDLALIKIDARGLPAARFGDSDQAEVGELVLAIGAPLGLEATVTQGVLSAKGRGGIGATEIEDYLQTDASINPGNSGGPLVNLRGEVLGINTIIIGRGTGIGMAIPSRLAQNVMDQILRQGRVERAWIGVGVQDVTSDLARTMGLPAVQGALINQIEPNGPAARAGLQVGDVVTAVDGQPVRSSHDLVRWITSKRVGEHVTITVLRNGRPHTIRVTTGTRPPPEQARTPERQREREIDREAEPARGLGLRVTTVTPQLGARLGIPTGGLLVTRVEPGGAADHAGLSPGDVILRADGREVRDSRDLLAAMRDKRATLLVRRGDRQVFIPLIVD